MLALGLEELGGGGLEAISHSLNHSFFATNLVVSSNVNGYSTGTRPHQVRVIRKRGLIDGSAF